MKRHISLWTIALALAAAGCGQMEGGVTPAGSPGEIQLEVFAQKSAPAAEDGTTRVTLSNDNLIWENTEKLAVLFGAAKDTTGGPGGGRAILDAVGEGRFKGPVDLSSWTLQSYSLDDVKAIVTPADRNFRYELNGSTPRLACPIAAIQVQFHNGVLNGEYVPLFARVNSSQLRQEEGNYMLDGIQLQYGCSLMRFHIYGTAPGMAGDEIFQSLQIQGSGKAITGTGYWTSSGFSSSVSGNSTTPITVRLTEECTAGGRSFDDAVQLYAAMLPRYETSNTPTLTKLTVTTDKGVYEKTVSVTLKLRAGHLLPVKVDLSTFTRTGDAAAHKTIKRGGVDSIVYNSYPYFYNKPIKVYTYVPSGDITGCKVLFAMHGSTRTGLSYLNYWTSIASKKRVIVISPCFDSDQYPSSYYQLGNVSWSSSAWRGKPHYTYIYNMIESIFDYMKDELGFSAVRYDLWGHSAGGQFSHRMMLHMPEARAYRIICSNSGYYTVPDPRGVRTNEKTFGFPYSVLGMNWTREQLAAYFARNLTVHLGTADTASTVEQDSQLPNTPGAYAQGPCRYERGKYFFARAKAVADSLGLPFRWNLVEVKGVAHSGKNMTQNTTSGAGVLLYGN